MASQSRMQFPTGMRPLAASNLTVAIVHLLLVLDLVGFRDGGDSPYSTSILGEVQARGLSPLFARLDSTSLERERLYYPQFNSDRILNASPWLASKCPVTPIIFQPKTSTELRRLGTAPNNRNAARA